MGQRREFGYRMCTRRIRKPSRLGSADYFLFVFFLLSAYVLCVIVRIFVDSPQLGLEELYYNYNYIYNHIGVTVCVSWHVELSLRSP